MTAYPMRSIRTQLVIWLVGGTVVLTCAAGIGLYEYMEEVLERSLDSALAAKSEAIIGAVHMEDDGQPHLEQSDPSVSVANRREGPFYFQIWRDDGTTLARAAPTGSGDASLPRVSKMRRHFQDARLPDGSSARILESPFTARPDEDEFDKPGNAAKVSPAHLTLVVAHDRRSIDGPLAVLLTGLLLAAGIVTAGILVIVSWGVGRGLLPLAEVSNLADRIGPESLEVRFPGPEKLPHELRPIGQKLNDLLDRLSIAFARERRFSAAVAHELRTPLAELRSACDVALRWPDDSDGLRTALSEVREVALQMTTMVQTLLSLTRQQVDGVGKPALESIRLASAVTNAWPEMPAAAAARQLILSRDLADDAIVQASPDLLTAVLRNLLGNAVDHAPAGGSVTVCSHSEDAGRWSLRISNTCQGLTAADLPRLFEPFWRADASRTGNSHAGLGLTLVKAYCEVMGMSIEAVLDPADCLQMILQFPK